MSKIHVRRLLCSRICNMFSFTYSDIKFLQFLYSGFYKVSNVGEHVIIIRSGTVQKKNGKK